MCALTPPPPSPPPPHPPRSELKASREAWKAFAGKDGEQYDPLYLKDSSYRRLAPGERYESRLSVDVVASCQRQKNFVVNVFNRFLVGQTRLGVARYAAFAALHKAACADGHGGMLVPTYDIDLAWHAHMLCTFEYEQLCGGGGKQGGGLLFDHDDSFVDRTPG